LLAEMGANYVQYLTTSQLLALAERTLKTYENSLRLVGLREKAGIGNNLDTQRAQAQLNASQFDVANLKAQRERAKNALTYLAGTPIDWDHFNNTALSAHLIAPVPVGLPSDVLLVRPDIAAAEYSLQAANANIGAARAMRFPSITLTGLAGKTSGDLSGLWNGLNIWTFLPQITLPIFTGGSLAANVELANTSQKLAWANYEKTIQNAFKEVSDVLADQSTLFDQLQAKEKQRNALKKAERLADLRYQEGLDNYLFLLSAQRDLYASEQSLLLTQQSLLLNRILTYKALGGDRDLIADLPNTPNFINNNDEQVTEAS
jgi:multidrug efflux system outer membrane protein